MSLGIGTACAEQPLAGLATAPDRIALLPPSATLSLGGTLQFGVIGITPTGDTVSVAVDYSGTGGTITATGLYTAGSLAGVFRVIATQQGGTLADTASVTIEETGTSQLTGLFILPASVTLQQRSNQQFTALGVFASGDTSAVNATWTGTGGTITPAGLYSAGGANGDFEVRATHQSGLADTSTVTIISPPPPGATPDPLLLPVATTSQSPLTAAYNALNVPAIPAGGSYLDPTTGVRVYKLTSATFPTASGNWNHDYGEGGDEVSLPYNGTTRAVLARGAGGYWLLDFTPGVGVSNPRRLTGNLDPQMDVAFAFSNNPATPYYAYVISNGAVRRFDIRTMTEAPGNGWPKADAGAQVWLQQSKNDELFIWFRMSTNTMVAYEPSTATTKTYTDAGANEPRIDRDGRYVGMSMNSPNNGLRVWDWNTGAVAWNSGGDPGIPFAHNASLRRQWLVLDFNASRPMPLARFQPAIANSGAHVGVANVGSTNHGNGNWIQYPADLNDQWAMFTFYGGLAPSGSGWLAPGGMVLVTANGQRRLLAHPYQTTGNYADFAFPKFSSDGRYVLFTSNMNGTGRNDLFLAELPTR